MEHQNAWSTNYLSQQTSEPAYYIVDCPIFRIACKSVILCLLTPFIRNDSLILLLFYQQSSFPSSKSHMLTYFLPWIQRTTIATRYILILHLNSCQFSFHHILDKSNLEVLEQVRTEISPSRDISCPETFLSTRHFQPWNISCPEIFFQAQCMAMAWFVLVFKT